MKPLKVTMSAFGSYGGVTEVDFRDVDHGLFLVTGDTGAGKTTIFDAVSFALFGELSGGARDGGMMRSQYAGEEEETYVELLFSDRGEQYTVRRSPTYQRISKRKNKNGVRAVTTVPAKASLILPDGSEFPGRIGEINEKIQEIVGVDRNQFAQIAMIAQGEYVKLLHASSKERKEIFGRIFNTGIYWRIQQRLRDENNELYGKLQDNKNLYEHEAEKVVVPEMKNTEGVPEKADEPAADEPPADEPTADETTADEPAADEPTALRLTRERWIQVRDSLETRPDEILELLAMIVKESARQNEGARDGLECAIQSLSDSSGRLGQVREKNKRLAGLEQARRKLAALEEQAALWQEKRGQQKKAEQARPVESAENAYRTAEKEWSEGLEQIARLESELESLKEPLRNADIEKAEKNTQLEQERPQLAAGIAKVSEQLPLYRELEETKAESGQLKGRLDALGTQKTSLETALKEQTKIAEQLREQQGRLEGCAALRVESAARLEQLNTRMQDLARLTEHLREMEELYTQREQKRAEVEQRQKRYEAASADYEEKNRRFIQVQAGILASQLEEGSPCPVCGSTHHPNKEQVKSGDVTERQVESARGRRDQADAVLKEALSAYQECNAGYIAMGRQAQADYKRVAGKAAETFTQLKEETGSLSAQCGESLDQETARYQSLQAQESAWENNKRLIREAEEKEAQLNRQLKEGQEAAAEAELVYRQSVFQLEQLKKNLSWETRREAEKELERQSLRLKGLEQEAKEAAARQEKLQSTVTEKNGYLVSEREKSILSEKKKETCRREWLKLMEEQGFSDEAEYRASVLSPGALRELHEAIGRYDSEYLTAKASYEQYRELTKGEEREPEEVLQAEIERLTEEKNRLSKESSRLAAIDSGNHAAANNIEKLLAEREVLREKKQLIETLYTTADGKVNRAARIDFQTYVQRQYFKQMVAAANKRLLPMTGGQFLLQCRELETLGRQGEVGLDLDVYSPASDRTRDVKTLSGGESFMAALSMALGMADVIQNTAGRVNIEAMFIDEGFGSLDEESRMKAIRILKELAGSRRLVGIISHVTELKEQLDRKLIVKKTEKGSSIRWELES